MGSESYSNFDPAFQPNAYSSEFAPSVEAAHVASHEVDVPIYSVDAVVRRSLALQQTVLAQGGSPP
jgi:hypothetical protein